ncbi:centromere protein S [Hyalella azteca]|uniref:Centromere protein S n=1 Tax=Hyalella azteca TaxID=294128 RepID=A0A8B7PCB8_HYAAZ|nr:centromere protein S [Hyalella azteca]
MNHTMTVEEKVISEAMHYAVGQICQEVGEKIGVKFTPEVMATIANIVSTQLDVYADDLASFARHARRTIVSTEDVQLIVRRNPSLKAHIEDKAVEYGLHQTSEKGLKKKKPMQAKISVCSPVREAEDENSDQTDVGTGGLKIGQDSAAVGTMPNEITVPPKDAEAARVKATGAKAGPSTVWPDFQLDFDNIETID